MPHVRDVVEPVGSTPRYSLVFLVHGDSDYNYHDALGNALRADDVVVREARSIAEANPELEVYIFHEMPRRHILFVFARRDGHAYHYRGGRLVAERSYWRDKGESRFAFAQQFQMEESRGQTHAQARMLLYFGHEIPEVGVAGYDESYPSRKVSVEDLAEAARKLVDARGKLDLLVLATCYGGTPYTIGKLAPFARYVIASPESLHLSYFDLEPLRRFKIDSEQPIASFVESFARNAFEHLRSEVQTSVSVVLYDTESTQGYLDSVADRYGRSLADASGTLGSEPTRCDCARDAAYTSSTMSAGVTAFYRAPNFGRMKHTPGHSGWECWQSVD